LRLWREEIAELAQGGKVEEAIALARVFAKRQDPEKIAIFLVDLGIKLSKQKNLYNEAICLFETASSVAIKKKCRKYANINESVALTMVGNSLIEERKPKDAEKYFEKAVKLNPMFSLAQQGYAIC